MDSGTSRETWAEKPGAFVAWNGDGSYTPGCSDCEWLGKDRAIHADAVRAAMTHCTSKSHQERRGGE